jgi:hypothetical protein
MILYVKKYQQGSRILYVDPNDPAGRARYQAAQDTLAVYNKNQQNLALFRKLPTTQKFSKNINEVLPGNVSEIYTPEYKNIFKQVQPWHVKEYTSAHEYVSGLHPKPERDAAWNRGIAPTGIETVANNVHHYRENGFVNDVYHRGGDYVTNVYPELKQPVEYIKKPYIKYSPDAPGPAKYWHIDPQKGTATPINKNVATTTYKNLEVVNTPYKNK